MREALVAVLLALTVVGCTCSSETAAGDPCSDGSCVDASVPFDGHPDANTRSEDAGADAATTACRPGELVPCGVTGSGCVMPCAADGTPGACQPAKGPSDFNTDPDNCGTCGNVCPTAVHADRKCAAGRCGRSACAKGFFDLDGDKTFGCEAECQGTGCKTGDGTAVTLTSPPLPEQGLVFQALSSGTSHGELVQTSASHTNLSSLGESTPPPADGASLSSKSYRHIGGFTSMEQQRK